MLLVVVSSTYSECTKTAFFTEKYLLSKEFDASITREERENSPGDACITRTFTHRTIELTKETSPVRTIEMIALRIRSFERRSIRLFALFVALLFLLAGADQLGLAAVFHAEKNLVLPAFYIISYIYHQDGLKHSLPI